MTAVSQCCIALGAVGRRLRLRSVGMRACRPASTLLLGSSGRPKDENSDQASKSWKEYEGNGLMIEDEDRT